MTSGFVVLAPLCFIVSVHRDKGTGERGGNGSLTASEHNMQSSHNKFDFRIRILHHITNPVSSVAVGEEN